jgi:dihydrofolate synthase/folylpolyglutamate synthase
MEAGIRSASLPYRFDVRKKNPYLIFDGGHNPDCIDALCRSLQAFSGDTKYMIVTGVLADKDYPAMYEMLQQYAEGFVCLTPPNHRGLPAKDLCEVVRRFDKPAETVDSIVEAVAKIKELRKQGHHVLVTGSLYIMADIVAAWNKTR